MSLLFRHAPRACIRVGLNAFLHDTAKHPHFARIEQYYFSLQASKPPARNRITAVALF